jgi:hypothetical protein
VSMGPVAGLKALQVVARVKSIMAIELLVAAQALDLRPESEPPPLLRAAKETIREHVPFLESDTVLGPLIAAIEQMMEAGELPPATGLAVEHLPEPCQTVSLVGVREACQPEGLRCVASMLDQCPRCSDAREARARRGLCAK